MNLAEFTHLAMLAGIRDTPARRAALSVLVDGVKGIDAARAASVTPGRVSQIVGQIRAAQGRVDAIRLARLDNFESQHQNAGHEKPKNNHSKAFCTIAPEVKVAPDRARKAGHAQGDDSSHRADDQQPAKN